MRSTGTSRCVPSRQVAVKQVIIRIVGAVREPPLQGLRPKSQNYLYDGNLVSRHAAASIWTTARSFANALAAPRSCQKPSRLLIATMKQI